MNIFQFLTILCVLVCIKSDPSNCYVLALQGGGDLGAYQAGALKGLIDNLSQNETQYDVVTGISAGTLNGIGFSLYPKGEEKSAVDFLLNTWRTIKGSGDIYKNWYYIPYLGPVYGLFYENSLFNTAPLKSMIGNLLVNKKLQRHFILGVTNEENMGYETYSNEDLLTNEDIVLAAMSSSAIPALFPNIQFRNKTYVDGGVKYGIDISSGINKCKALGFSDANIVVDVVNMNSKKLTKRNPSNEHPINILMRVFEIFSYDMSKRYIYDIMHYFPNIKFRYIVEPSESLPSGSYPVVFNPDEIEFMINLGIKDAISVIKKGEKVGFTEKAAEYINQIKERRTIGKSSKAAKNFNTNEKNIFLE